MKLITRDTDYAVKALSYIARHKGETLTVSELAKVVRIPQPFLRKILQVLNRKHLVISYKGRGGGFRLAITPKEILLVDLIKIFQGPLKLNECLFKKRICPDITGCVLKSKLDIIEKRVIRELESITIESLLNDGGRYGEEYRC